MWHNIGHSFNNQIFHYPLLLPVKWAGNVLCAYCPVPIALCSWPSIRDPLPPIVLTSAQQYYCNQEHETVVGNRETALGMPV